MSANNLSVRFVNKSQGASSYLWLFGDGSDSTEENPEHTYVVGGAYVVTLTAFGPDGQGQTSKTVITVGVLNDILLTTFSGDQIADVGGDLISVPAPT